MVAFASDDWYAKYLQVAICSLLTSQQNPSNYKIIVLDGWISQENKESVDLMVKEHWSCVEFYSMLNNNYSAYNTTYISKETYYRLDLPEILNDIDRVLYLDCDLLVVWDISYLFSMDLKNTYFWAVSEETMVHSYREVYDLNDHLNFFNAGVLLMNLIEIKKDGDFKSNILNFLTKNNNKLMACDQDALNYLYAEKYTPLHPKYNVLPYVLKWKWWYEKDIRLEAVSKPSIIHFAWEKPRKLHSTHPYKFLFVRYWLDLFQSKISFKERYFNYALLKKHYIYELRTLLIAKLPRQRYFRLIFLPAKFVRKILQKIHSLKRV